MSRPLDDARRGARSAAEALEAFRRESGAAPEGPALEDAGLKAALEQTRRALEEKARELEAERLRRREVEAERDALRAMAAEAVEARAAEAQAVRAAERAVEARQSAAAEGAALSGRLTLQQAELVRLESLRRKAEEELRQADLARRQVEDALRRELRSAHAALDRAAAEAGAREARVQTDLQGLQRRLDAALTRTEAAAREQRVEREKWRVERERLAASLQRAAAVHAALRKEAAELRGGNDAAAEAARAESLRAESAAAAGLAASLPVSAHAPEGAAALVARLRPAAAAAYERLRELSAAVPLSEAERASLRRAASALAGLCDATALLERYLDDGPGGAAGALEGLLERVKEDWRRALERKGVTVLLAAETGLPRAVFDADDLRLALGELMRNAFEVLPARSRVTLGARRAGPFVEVFVEDDGPGLAARKLKGLFDPAPEGAGRLGLGLAFARRAARRWGGEAEAFRGEKGGLRVVLRLIAA